MMRHYATYRPQKERTGGASRLGSGDVKTRLAGSVRWGFIALLKKAINIHLRGLEARWLVRPKSVAQWFAEKPSTFCAVKR